MELYPKVVDILLGNHAQFTMLFGQLLKVVMKSLTNVFPSLSSGLLSTPKRREEREETYHSVHCMGTSG